MLKLDDLFAEVALTLNTQSTAGLIEKFTLERLGECPCGGHHQVERLDALNRSGQDQEQTNAGNFLCLDVLQIEAPGFDKARRAENGITGVATIVTVKDSEFAVT